MSSSRQPLPEVRKLRFPLTTDNARDWFGNQAISDLFHGLSVFFPLGEQHFIYTVRPFVDQIQDPDLKKEVEAFIKQEAYHSREHLRYNEILNELGYPAAKLEKLVKSRIGFVKKYFSKSRQLAGTCAAEHFTAILANALLSEPEVLAKADPRFAALWQWHAIEELEHKAVAFDVYQATCGTYFERVRSMFFVTLFFSYDIVVHTNEMMRTDGIKPRDGWQEIGRVFFKQTRVGRRVLSKYFDYYKPKFHPWQHDNRHFIEEWNERFDALVQALGIDEGKRSAA